MQLGTQNGRFGYYSFSGGSNPNEVAVITTFHSLQTANNGNETCSNCGWNLLVGFEGEATAGIQGGVELLHAVDLKVNVASVTAVEFKATNLDFNNSVFHPSLYKISQGFEDATLVSFAYKHSFMIQNEDQKDEEHELRVGAAFLGATFTFNENGGLKNLYLGFDPALSGAFLVGGELKYKFGANYAAGN